MGSRRIAIISDLHGNRAATEAVLADIDAEGIESIWCLGDLVGYGAFPNETIALIRERDIPTIAGNYDDGVGFDPDSISVREGEGHYGLKQVRERVHLLKGVMTLASAPDQGTTVSIEIPASDAP